MKIKISNKTLIRVFSGIGIFIFLFFAFQFFNNPRSLEKISAEIIKLCVTEDSRQTCYDTEIPKIIDRGLTLEQSIDVIKLIQNQDSGYWFCHAVAHKLTTKEYYKNPKAWKEIMVRSPMGMCSNGFLHGALQAHFSTETLNGVQMSELMPDLQTICEKRENWQPTSQQQSSCYHELGHLSMYLTHGNVREAAKVCSTVGLRSDGRNYLQTCHEGIFMQVFEPREPDDFELIYDIVPQKEKLGVCEQYSDGVMKGGCWKIGWVEKYKEFCNQFEGDVRSACFREAWVIKSDDIQKAEAIVEYCTYAEDISEKRKCYNKLFYSLMSIFNFDTKKLIPICLGLPQSIKGQCFANTASRLIETDRRLIKESVAVCKEADKIGIANECYQELSHYAGFVFPVKSPEFYELCDNLPNKWKEQCLSRN